MGGSTNKKLILAGINKFIFKILDSFTIFGHLKGKILTLGGSINKILILWESQQIIVDTMWVVNK